MTLAPVDPWLQLAMSIRLEDELDDLGDERDLDTLALAHRAPTCSCERPLDFRDDPLDPRCIRCGKAMP